jgi:PAS domain S-box-containing protein
MQSPTTPDTISPEVAARSREIFDERRRKHHCKTDRNFSVLMICQWVAALFYTLLVSPRTWDGDSSTLHPHVWLVLFFGGAVTGLPVALAYMMPGSIGTRHVIAVSQALMSSLLIHISGGRIETHFHVFGSLAFLAFYRDWKVLITASLVVAADHLMRGIYWPASIFGVLASSPWRWLEHAGWVVFEDVFLVISIRQTLAEMMGVAERQAKLEAVNGEIERQVAERTAELVHENTERKNSEAALRESELRFRQMAENIQQVFWMARPHGEELIYISPAYEQIWARTCESAYADPNSRLNAIVPEDRAAAFTAFEKCAAGDTFDIEYRIARPDGSHQWISDRGFPVRDDSGKVVRVCGIAGDITARKQAEEKLTKAHRELLDASRLAGMAEVSTSVLHNVGNVLNSVNISVGVAADKIGRLKTDALSRLATILAEHSHDLAGFVTKHPQGTQLPVFIARLGEHFTAEQEAALGELESLRTNVEHINEIVSMQQSYSTGGGLIEVIPAAEVIEIALRINAAAFERHGCRVVREFDPTLPPLLVDRNKLLLILVNLIRNAKYACDDGGGADKCIVLRTHMTANGCAGISVRDNGVGIPPENLDRIFEHGFTTRKGGHGFGLHSSALAARDMSGSLHAQSKGHGSGAIFTIELPLYTKKS